MNTIAANVADSINEVHKQWGWYLALGITMIVAGAYAIYADVAATVASVLVLGAVVFVAGIAQLIGAFMARGAGHVILFLLIGALDVIVGVMLMQHPEAGALTVTLLLSSLFVFGGLFRFVTALLLQLPHYGWMAFSGLVTLALGVLLWLQWPFSGVWFIGFYVGVILIFAGVAWSALAFKLKAA